MPSGRFAGDVGQRIREKPVPMPEIYRPAAVVLAEGSAAFGGDARVGNLVRGNEGPLA
jgi:hypothetical protein